MSGRRGVMNLCVRAYGDPPRRPRVRTLWNRCTRTASLHINSDVLKHCMDDDIEDVVLKYMDRGPVETLKLYFRPKTNAELPILDTYEDILLAPALREIYVNSTRPVLASYEWVETVLLPQNQLLRVLSIDAMQLSSKGSALPRCLASNTCLRVLKLPGLVLTEDDVIALCAALRSNTTLRRLMVRWKPTSNGSARAVASIAELVAHNRTLEMLRMEARIVHAALLEWDRAALRALVAALNGNTVLRVFGFTWWVSDAIAVMQHNTHTVLSGSITLQMEILPIVRERMSAVLRAMLKLQSPDTLLVERDAAIAKVAYPDEVGALLLANERVDSDAALPAPVVERVVAEIGAGVVAEHAAMTVLPEDAHAAFPTEAPYPRCAVM